MEDTEIQSNNSRTEHLKPWQFKPGQSGNPGGKPKGTISMKQYAQRYLREMTDEEKDKFMEGLDKVDIWKLAEGNPENKTDITSKGEKIGNSMAEEVLNEADKTLKDKKLNEHN